MKFLDSNILAYAFYDNKMREGSQQAIKDGGMINTINLVEAFNIIEFETTRERATEAVKGLLKSHLKIIDVDLDLIFEALKRNQKYKHLKFNDLVHYVSALAHNCESIVSFDRDFDKLEIRREEP